MNSWRQTWITLAMGRNLKKPLLLRLTQSCRYPVDVIFSGKLENVGELLGLKGRWSWLRLGAGWSIGILGGGGSF
jgi:hypothetical protein